MTYNKQQNTLTEKATIEKPTGHYDDCEYLSPLYNHYWVEWRKYEQHLASLRSIPCHTSCRSLWEDGKDYVEGKDYEVQYIPTTKPYHGGGFEKGSNIFYVPTAVPLPAQQESRGEALIDIIAAHPGISCDSAYPCSCGDYSQCVNLKSLIQKIQQHFTLIRK